MAIERVPLLSGRREILFALLAWSILFALHLLYLYIGYLQWKERPFYYDTARVVQEYSGKNPHASYRILKLQDGSGKTLFTRSYTKRPLSGKLLRLQFFPKRVGFLDYLRGPYIPSRIKGVQENERSLHSLLEEAITREHDDQESASFYRAIFLASPLAPELRERIAALGVSHLVALSGFHLGILWGGIFLLLSPLYRFFQRRHFPWRYSTLDLGSLSLLLLGGYLWLTGFPPSLLRSYAMLAIGWAALLLGLELLSFGFLAVAVSILLLLKPPLALSLGFWLSVSGVFYIYLLLHYWKQRSGKIFALLVMPIGIFLLMLPITHTLFKTLSPWQWLSPLLSLLFVLFYPLAILAHLIGVGALFDPMLQWLWSLPGPTRELQLPLWYLLVYLALSIAAIRWSWAFIGIGGMIAAAVGWLYLL